MYFSIPFSTLFNAKTPFLVPVSEIFPSISSLCLHFLPAQMPGCHNLYYPARSISFSPSNGTCGITQCWKLFLLKVSFSKRILWDQILLQQVDFSENKDDIFFLFCESFKYVKRLATIVNCRLRWQYFLFLLHLPHFY